MKKITSLFSQSILLAFCLLSIPILSGQTKKQSQKLLFGNSVKSRTVNPQNGIIRCATSEYEEFLQKKNPKRRSNIQFENWLNPLVSKYKSMQTDSKSANTIIRIPVVVHVIHSGQEIGTAPNILDAQVESQITVLNQDFRKILGTPGHNTNPVGADVEIEFVLAKQDPNGNPTNGVDRVHFTKGSWSFDEIESIIKPATIWSPNMYLNMWSVQFDNDALLGYAQFPDNNFPSTNPNYLDGLNSFGGSANTDGVVSRYEVFGSNDFGSNFLLNNLYNKGRTMTHEVGHFLGLLHIWGDGGSREEGTKDCDASDYCADTPQAGWENYECNPTYDSCPTILGKDMIENYMDYTNDECMNIFTQNQKERMVIIMNNAARRVSLKTSTKATAIPLFTNDAEVKIEGNKYFLKTDEVTCDYKPDPSKKIALYNRGTSILTTIGLSYKLNNGATQNFTWNGSLEPNKSTVVPLPNSDASGNLSVTVLTSNGVTDQRTTNNNASATFEAPVSLSNYTQNNFVFKLQRDKWGSETVWSLKNSAGTSLYKGGPYIDTNNLPALITQNWTLPNNDCYTFTIEDLAGDGICCGDEDGDGYFEIKSTDGLVTVKTGTQFGSSDSKSFTISTLGINESEIVNSMYLYPNPTTAILNINVSSEFGLPNNYFISNVLGQKITQKEITNQADLSVNTSSLAKGTYFITVSKGIQSKTMQFIKE